MLEVPVAHATPPEWDKAEIRALIHRISTQDGIDENHVSAVVSCESHFQTDAVGDSGDSIGLVQINLPSHPEVSLLEAENASYSLDFLSDEWKAGHEDLWTCYRILRAQYGNGIWPE